MATIGKYQIVEELGRGGMGVVYRAYDPVMDREVAIKVVSDVMMSRPEMKDRFLREARTAGKLSHENITIPTCIVGSRTIRMAAMLTPGRISNMNRNSVSYSAERATRKPPVY